MARFIRDEKRTYPFMWLAMGGVFAASTVWAVYAELVTRVPWQNEQKAFFQMELEQSKSSLERAKSEWDKEIEPSLADRVARKKQLEESVAHGEYKQAHDRLDKLNRDFADAELGKTFSGSDLDEGYYYRNLAEYERDAASKEVLRLYQQAYAAEDPHKGGDLAAKLYADPEPPAKVEGESEKLLHLRTEIARMTAHVQAIGAAMGDAPTSAVRESLKKSRDAEQHVIDRLKVEQTHQKRVDETLAKMAVIDGPADPPLSEKDPQKRADERKREREKACQGHEDTRNCILWLKLEPVDAELKAIDVEYQKRRRTLTDAELREQKADERANPKFDPENLIASLVGPFQIEQTVVAWIEHDRDVDKEQVDRCSTCHMGVDSGNYSAPEIQREFRTHPNRGVLLGAHPVEKFGCTSCHQGQGRATDMLSHSGWHLEKKHGKERWHFAGDHYWEDPLLPVGEMSHVVVDDANDELEVKVGKGKWATVKLDHRGPRDHDKDAEVAEDYDTEEELFGALQEKVAKAIEDQAEVLKTWHAVVRKVDNRVQIGLEQNKAEEHVAAKDLPAFAVRFTKKPELGALLGWDHVDEASAKQPLQVAPHPPSEPVRSEGMAFVDKDGRYHPPRGDEGLQVPDDMRNRFIEALPEVESGCLRCHTQDVDLRPRASRAKYITAKLDYEKAEAWRKKDTESYKKAHDGSDDLPVVPPNPAQMQDIVPTFDEGRALFKKLNCVGCHILEGYPADRNSGPSLDNVTAKVSPAWVLQWIRNPRGWREKTRMPNLWPRPLDPATKRPFPEGSPEYEEWAKTMRDETIAVASFLVQRSESPGDRPGMAKDARPLKEQVKGYADVPNATAERGKKLFESYGCQGCHAREDRDTADEKLPEPWRSRERDVAPTLANMGSKTTADWIAYWVEEPNRYWHGTKMPDLRLTRDEAASIGKYVASLKSDPLTTAKVDAAEVAIVSDAAKRNERVPCANAGGQMLSRAECGEKLIGYYGCFGCHQISGFEKNAPVAPELGGFAKKDVSTLDFGYALADHHLQTTETFATLKLDSPRIYRRDRIELKMADFDASPREIRALVTFLKGLVQSRPKAGYDPGQHGGYSAALEGRQLVEDYNCRGCHMVEDRGADIDAYRQAQLSVDVQQRAPWLGGEGMRVQPEWLFSFIRDPQKNGIRPWLHPEWAYAPSDVPDDKKALRMPTFNMSPEQVTAIVRYFATWDGEEYPYQAPKANQLTEQQKLYALTHMIAADKANCLSCHYQGDFPKERGMTELGKMAPNFNNVSSRLRPAWVKAWLLRPQNWMPYTKMTAFWATADRPKDASMWPAESDPFASKTAAWDKVPGFEAYTSEQQAETVRDFLFTLHPGAPAFPPAGQEATSPLVKGETAPAAAAEEPADKGKAGDKGKADKKKKTGSIGGPHAG